MAYSYATEQALRATSVLHKNQVCKGAVPYPFLTHLYAVMLIASDYTNDEDTLVSALLSKTLEDTDYTEKELEDDFGGTVKDIVVSISHDKQPEDEQLSHLEMRKRFLKKLKRATEKGLIIIASDTIHAMRSAVEDYYDDHSSFIAEFGALLNEHLMYYQELSNHLNRNLKNAILSEFNNVFTEYKNFLKDVEKKQTEF